MYRLDITVSDLVADRTVTVSAPFTVKGLPFKHAGSLAFRNVGFTEGDDGPTRASAVCPAGSTVWLEFESVGFKSGADNAVRLRHQLTVTDAVGGQRVEHVVRRTIT